MRRGERISRVLLGVALGLALCSPARAAEDDAERARRDLEEGVRLFNLGDFEGARAMFLRADAAHHRPAIVFNVARAEEKLGNVQAAIDAYEAYVHEAGTASELGLAATVAVAELKERSARIRIESTPVELAVAVDGRVQYARTPTVVWVRPGRHRVQVSGEGKDESRIVDASRPGDEVATRFVFAESGARGRPSDDFGWFAGTSAALIPYHFLGEPKAPLATRFADHTNVTLGVSVDGGVRIAFRVYLSADLFASVGTYGHPNYVLGGGIGVLYRTDIGLWVRGAATIADVDSNKTGKTLSTDVVLGPSLEVGYELDRRSFGAWFVAAGACLLPADALRDNDALFFPVRLGFRAM